MYCQKGPNGQNNQKCLKNGQCSHQRPDTSAQMSATYLNNCNNNPSMDPMVDRTPCGSATMTPNFDESYDTPPYIRWSQDFHYLINDVEGIQLFKNYLKSEGLEQLLDFWFACEGLKTNETEDKEIIRKLIYIIYKKFIRNSKTIDLSDKVRNALKQELTSDSTPNQNYDPKYDRNVFETAQHETEDQLKGSIYVNFLRSDIYLRYLQSNAFPNNQSVSVREDSNDKTDPKDNVSSTNDNSMDSSLDDYNTKSSQYYEVLPTVDEESELQTTEPSVNRTISNAYLRSQTQNKFQSIPVNPCHNNLMSSGSNDTLVRSLNKILSQQTTRSTNKDNMPSRLSTESHPLSPNHNRVNTAYQSYLRRTYSASKSMYDPNPANPYHVKYATVLPTSARDSELHSISSHSTNDSMSCVSGHNDATDTNGIRTKKQNFAIKHNAKLNSNNNNMISNNFNLHLRVPKSLPPNANDALHPEEFAKNLIEKLEDIKRKRELEENKDKKMTELLQLTCTNTVPNVNKSNPNRSHQSVNISENSGCRLNKTLKEVLKERGTEHKFEFCPPDNDQEILDKHFAQVFSETPNETPTDSIGRCVSPPKQPNFRTLEHRMTPPVSSYDSTQVGVTVKYSTEQIPYRLTLTGPHITLRKFKQQIPAKRGNWQYYFKRKCDDKELIDISAPHVWEKISDDSALLPVIDGKIVAELQESN